VNSSVTYTLGAALENLILTGVGAINGTGNALNNNITGESPRVLWRLFGLSNTGRIRVG
jgi:hypothetical protein